MKRRSLFLLALVLVLSLVSLTACNKDNTTDEKENVPEKKEGEDVVINQLEKPKKGDTVAVIDTTEGVIKVRLFPETTPKTAENFIKHSESGYYDGLTFHRVMEEFMIQGGDPKGDGTGGESIWNEDFEDEFSLNLRNYRGALSMANRGPNTNGSQFFIVQKTSVEEDLLEQLESFGEKGGFPKGIIDNYKNIGGTPWLDFKHTVFGQVYDGMDIVDKIAKTKVGDQDRPLKEVKINKIAIEKIK